MKNGKAHNDETPGSFCSHHILGVFVRESQIPVSGRKTAEGANEGEEDEEEGDVGSERADEKDEAYHSCVQSLAFPILRRVEKRAPK